MFELKYETQIKLYKCYVCTIVINIAKIYIDIEAVNMKLSCGETWSFIKEEIM